MKLKIAEHVVKLIADKRFDKTLDPYRPFICDDELPELYTFEMVSKIDCTVTKTLLEDTEMSNSEMTRVDAYQTEEGMLFNIIMPEGEENQVDGQLLISGNHAKFAMNEYRANNFMTIGSFNNAMILSFTIFTLPLNTMLLHASAILKDNKAHLFLGKSGTGKSTHSQMWLNAISCTELLNDDHPVIRKHSNGEVIAYGSPWSGKTPCYRNLSAPLRAIVRIKRAPYNKLSRLSTIKGYASVMTSCASMQWHKELSDAKARTLEAIVTSVGVGCYNMECLPNEDAALCCYNTLCEEK